MTQIHGIVQGTLPSLGTDATQRQVRLDRYGAPHSRGELFAWAEEGSYFRALASATPGAGLAQAITTSFSATAVPLVMVNGSSSKIIIPHYIRLVNTAAGASTTSSQAAISIDTANRYSSGGTDLSTLVYCANTAYGPASSLSSLRAGTVTASAAGAGTRYASNFPLKAQAAPCWTVGDEVLISFGDPGLSGAAGLTSGAATISIVRNVGPVILGAQNSSMLLHLWNVANATTAPSWAFEIAWWER